MREHGPVSQTVPEPRRRRTGAAALLPAGTSRWNLAVAVSALIVVVVLLAGGISWLASLRTNVVTYGYSSALKEVALKITSGSVVIVGSSSSTVEVRRTDRYAFGHRPRERRTSEGGVLRIVASCPRIVVGTCSSSYEVAVPETLALDVQTGAGDVRLDGFRGEATVRTRAGNVDAEAYCGFGLSATSTTGDVHVAAACAPERLQLRTGSGDATALVPPGRYRVFAEGARTRVSGVVRDPTAPFAIDVRSAGGSATIGGGL